MKTITIALGGISDPLDKQLEKQDFKFNVAIIQQFEECRKAIFRLRMADLLSDSAHKGISDKLSKKIIAHVNKMNKNN